MELGILTTPLHAPSRAWRDVLREDQEMVVLADRLGYTEAWVGEHIASESERIVSSLMFLATLADKTARIRLGTSVINLPYRHPAHIAGEVGMLDQLCDGRLMLGIGPGGFRSDNELFGSIEGDIRGRMMLESLDIMRFLWREDPPYRYDGAFWNIDVAESTITELGIGITGKPLQAPHPPIAVALRSPQSGIAELAAQQDWLPISGNFMPADTVRKQWDIYAAARAERRVPADREIWRVARNILVTESDAEAAAYLAKPDTAIRYYFRYLFTLEALRGKTSDALDDQTRANVEEEVEEALRSIVIAGSPQTVLQHLAAFSEEVGGFGVLLATAQDWDDPELWQRSMRLLAEDVMPALQ